MIGVLHLFVNVYINIKETYFHTFYHILFVFCYIPLHLLSHFYLHIYNVYETLPTNELHLFALNMRKGGLLFLHLCTSKTPTLLVDLTGKGNSYHALKKCEGVKKHPENGRFLT